VDTELCRALRDLRATGDNAPAPETRTRVRERLEAVRQGLGLDAAERPRLDLVTAAADAVAALATATGKHTEVSTVAEDTRGQVRVLCPAAAGEMLATEGPRACTAKGISGEPQRSLNVKRAMAERQVASIEDLQAGSETSKAALAKAETALITAKTKRDNPLPDTPLSTVLATGAGRLAQTFPGLGGTRVPVGLAPVGWAAVAALVLWGYRRLEITNSGLGLGLVSIDPLKGGGKDNAELDAAFRRHVIANVPEPGTVPGATTSSVSDLLETAGGPASKILASFMKIVQGLAATVAGYKVDATYQSVEPSAEGAKKDDATKDDATKDDATSLGFGTHEVFVRVRNARTGATRATKTVRGASAALAVRNAGYWAAPPTSWPATGVRPAGWHGRETHLPSSLPTTPLRPLRA